MTVQGHSKLTTPMLITKLGQHKIILGKPWMKKHGVILDMRNDQLIFWPEHCQHKTKPCAELLHAGEQHTEKPYVKEPHASRPMKILKQLLNGLLEPLLPYLFPSTQGVSKVASTPKAVKPEKKKKSTITYLRGVQNIQVCGTAIFPRTSKYDHHLKF